MSAKRPQRDTHVPVITANYSPFRLILREEDSWSPSIEQINRRTYDYVKLHRMSLFIDIGILPLSLGLRFDGTLVLPATSDLVNPENALQHYNQFLCELLLGGVYCEAVSPDDVCLGQMTHTAYCRITGSNRGRKSRFHEAICTTAAGSLDAIQLLRPDVVRVSTVRQAISAGRLRFGQLSPLVPETLLHGTTFYARNQWADALVHLWTSVEQLIEGIWSDRLVHLSRVPGVTDGRRKAFLSDNRTWTASTRLEVLFQKSLIPDKTYALLDIARQGRNRFAHTGAIPTVEVAEAALEGLFQLVSLRATGFAETGLLRDIAELVKGRSHLYASWDRQGKPLEGVTHWMELPPIPGDPRWGDTPFEIIDELQLKELKRQI